MVIKIFRLINTINVFNCSINNINIVVKHINPVLKGAF